MPGTAAFASSPPPMYIISNYRRFEPGERHINRISTAWVLVLMLGGTLYFAENGSPVELSAGDWYIQAPGLMQEGHRPCPAPHYYYIHFTATGQAPGAPGCRMQKSGDYVAPSEALLTLPVRGKFAPARFTPLFDRLERVKRLRPNDLFMQQAVFLEILSALADTLESSQGGGSGLAKAVMDYLCAHFNEDVRINALPQRFHFSSDYLSKVFKNEYGRSPKEHIRELRLNLAMELLATTDMPVALVSEAAGYGDQSVFFRAFKGRCGLSPSEWRSRKVSDNVADPSKTIPGDGNAAVQAGQGFL